jgi:predicted nucleic acid-binding protein
MILADTSVWVDHFRQRETALAQLLQRNAISTHPFVVMELALGNLPERQKTIALLDRLPMVKVAQISEVRHLIEAHSLFRRGIGMVDAHLIASALITPYTVLWSRDRRLREVAEKLGLNTTFS